MTTTCFMVDSTLDCWLDNGAPNVGAMCWRYHELDKNDTDPLPFPHLGVMTKAGLVCLDCPESSEPYGKWTRTGDPPKVTVKPSLNVNDESWHGHLTAGVLIP